MANTDLLIEYGETFDEWRTKFNLLTERSEPIGDIGELDTLAVPLAYRTSLVTALNYVYEIRISEGQPVTESALTDCYIPVSSKLYFGSNSLSYLNVGYTTDNDIVIGANGNDNFIFRENGRLGVGIDPESLLHVNGVSQANSFRLKNPNNSKTLDIENEDIGDINYHTITPDSDIILNNSNNDTIINSGTGKVGIGYNSSDDLVETVNVKSASSSVGVRMQNATLNYTFTVGSTGYGIYHNDTNLFQAHTNGNIGINRNVPTYKLDVNGSFYASTATVGTGLSVGATSVISLSGTDVNFANIHSLTAETVTVSSQLKHGATVIVDTDAKIDFTRIKNFTFTGYTTDNLPEGSTNKYFSGKTTTDLSEGTNLYFTNARAISAITPGVTMTGVLGLANYAQASLPTNPVPATGSIAYDSTRKVPVVYDGAQWKTPATGWRDLVSSLSAAAVPPANAPTLTAFGTSTTGDPWTAYAFDINDYVYALPFHVDHDIMPNSNAYIHVHWSTNGTSTATVKWQITLRRAKGHNQATFANTETVYTVEQAASGTAWQHMITESSTPIVLLEPDELLLVTVKRITNGGTDNANTVFGLMVDLHYQSDRNATPNRVPNFYA